MWKIKFKVNAMASKSKAISVIIIITTPFAETEFIIHILLT